MDINLKLKTWIYKSKHFVSVEVRERSGEKNRRSCELVSRGGGDRTKSQPPDVNPR